MAEKFALNFILMMNWSDFLSFLKRFLSLFGLLFFINAANGRSQTDASNFFSTSSAVGYTAAEADTTIPAQTFPDPSDVLYKSLILPGWGQVVNKQTWKVPIVYGLLAGLTGFSIYLTKKYHDYRAAFYNINDQTPDDERFGSTPGYLQNGNLSSLQSNRDFFRNRRDFIYVTIVLAYGLNVIDAYVFAHLRSFDVSEDLSLRTTLKPNVLAHTSPGVTLQVQLFNKKK
jgi:hypothetical protein